jgi:flagellin
MGLRINNNLQSVNGHRNLQRNDWNVGRSMEKLSSGLRINRAADDSAGLIISEQMRAQITGLDTAISNSETAVNMVQTAEGALDEMNTLLNKARSLALHAANEGANDQAQLVADQAELDNIIASVTRIAENTQFGTKKILDGSLSSFRSNDPSLVGSTQIGDHYTRGLEDGSIVKGYHTIQITTQATFGNLSIDGTLTSGVIDGTGSMAAATFDLDNMSGAAKFKSTFTVAVAGYDVTVTSGMSKTDFVNALNAVGKSAGFFAYTSGSFTGGGVSTGNIVLQYRDAGATAEVSFEFKSSVHTGALGIAGTHTAGTDMAATLFLNTGAVGGVGTTGAGAGATVDLAQSGTSMTLVSTTAGQGYRIDWLAAMSASGNMDIGHTGSIYHGVIDGMSSGASFQVGANAGQKVTVDLNSMKASDIGRGVSSVFQSLSTLQGGSLTGGFADDAIKVIDKAIDDVTVTRGNLGAFQANTLESGLNSLRVTRENLISAESTIRDVDFAKESAEFTKHQILVQASTAMLAQANQLPQNVLQLLG